MEETGFTQPNGLSKSLRTLYGLLWIVFIVNGVLSFAFELHFKHIIPEGQFFSKTDGLVKLENFDPERHWLQNGKYPVCHVKYESTENISVFDKPNVEVEDNDKIDLSVNPPFSTLVTISKAFPTLHNLVLSTFVLLIGCKHSVWLYAKTEDKDDHEEIQSLQSSEAYWAPIVGSCALFSLYLVYKYLPKEYIRLFLTVYIFVVCVTSILTNVNNFVALFKDKKTINDKDSRVLLSYDFKKVVLGIDLSHTVKVTLFDVGALLLGVFVAFIYEYFKFIRNENGSKDTILSSMLNNFLGVSFCLLALKQINLSDYKTGAILLLGLFFYDIFWVFYSEGVFGSNVMVSVATQVDAPIKLLFFGGIDICRNARFNMLGLGDIVVPGIFLSFLAKFDCFRCHSVAGKDDYTCDFLYFNVSMVSYVLSLVTTIVAMYFMEHAQPALLYIVPFVLVSSFGLALIRKEVNLLLNFSMEEEESEEKEKSE